MRPRVTRGALVICRWHDAVQLGSNFDVSRTKIASLAGGSGQTRRGSGALRMSCLQMAPLSGAYFWLHSLFLRRLIVHQLLRKQASPAERLTVRVTCAKMLLLRRTDRQRNV